MSRSTPGATLLSSGMDAGGRWQTPTPIATTFALYPHVAMDRNGDATAVWQGPRGSVVAASKPRMAGGWSTQQTIYHGNPNITPYPQVSVGSHGEAIATWSGNPVQSAVRPGPGAAWQHPVRLGFGGGTADRSEEHTSELQSRVDLVCRLLLEKKKRTHIPLNPSNKKNKKKTQN